MSHQDYLNVLYGVDAIDVTTCKLASELQAESRALTTRLNVIRAQIDAGMKANEPQESRFVLWSELRTLKHQRWQIDQTLYTLAA